MHDFEPHSLKEQIAAAAAAMVVEEGLEYGPAKRRALKQLGLPARTALPDNDLVEAAVREYIALFCADTQPAELAALRQLALLWMQRMAEFRPFLGGAVWRGTATRLSAVHLDLYCDDAKAAEIALLNQGVRYEIDMLEQGGAPVDVLTVSSPSRTLGMPVTVHLIVRDHDDLRGALKPDARGRTWRGDLIALRRLTETPA